MTIPQLIFHNLHNISGWRTNRHLLVMESDDWGSIRMPSLKTYNDLQSSGVQLGKYGFEQFDTIASTEDLEKLFELCNSFRDINDNPLVITANSVVANPDFKKIKESEYTEYFYEPITATMERYYPNGSPFELWKEGMGTGVFHPQLHGREHVNVPMWLNSLRHNHPGARTAFDNGVFSFVVSKDLDGRERNTTAFDYRTNEELEFHKKAIVEAASLFKDLFGYESKSFIAPAYKWDSSIEKTLASVGVKYLQGTVYHRDNGRKHLMYCGKKNGFGQIYLTRNAYCEYSTKSNHEWNGECLKNIEIAFKWGKPAIVCMHRLNFIGAIDVNNRDTNLIKFNNLITAIQNKWPDVEFITSDQLGDIISRGVL